MATLRDSHNVTKVDSDLQANIAAQIDDFDVVVNEAAKATQKEKEMGILETMRTHKRATMWSLIVSLAIIMEGWDCMLFGNFYGQEAFTRRYGELGASGTYQIPAAWQAGLSNGSNIGQLLGLWAVGLAADKWGYRKTIAANMIALTGFIAIPVFAQNLPTLLAGQILMGVPLGAFQSLCCSYAADVCPVGIRHLLTAWVNICWCIGQLAVTGLLRGMIERQDSLAYRLPFALQWMWPVPIMIVCWLAPESPWYLVRHGKLEEAERSLRRLADNELSSQDIVDKLAAVRHTNELEKQVNEGGGYKACFEGANRRRTGIALMVWLIQQTCGSSLMGFSTYFLISAGLPAVQAANFTVIQFSIAILGTASSFFTMSYFGRRTLYMFGQAWMLTMMLVIGIMGFFTTGNISLSLAVGALLLLFAASYQSTIGPVCYTLVAEVPGARTRAKTVVIARFGYNVAGIVLNAVNPYWLNPDSSSFLGAKSGLVWAGLNCLTLIWTYFCLPETRGRTFGELDVLFENKVSARKFSSTAVDQYHGAHALAEKEESDSLKEKNSNTNVATLDA